MEKWLRESLSDCLQFDVPDDMIKYIMSIKTLEEFDEHCETLLNKECDKHRLFISDAKKRLFSKALPIKNKQLDPPIAQNTKTVDTNPIQPIKETNNQGAKKKTKFVSLYTNDGTVKGETILLQGRHPCNCEASQHQLINNCLSCGRIVCSQEGSGPCFFCGEIVGTSEEMKNNIRPYLIKKVPRAFPERVNESLQKAIKQRDRLLEYDQNSEKRTTIIDDELDYFQENSVWLSDAERTKLASLQKEMHDQKHASRAQRKIKIDFAGREIEDEMPISDEDWRKYMEEALKITKDSNDSNNWSLSKNSIKITPETCDADPMFEGLKPVYKPTSIGKELSKNLQVKDGMERCYNRVQDKELLEMQDMRQCLSLHQPWASLLVAGIKKHEGRVWYSEHRGRLWIASTAKEPRDDDIRELENFYKNYYNDPTIKFPDHYPVGCLLGCVNLEDCLPQEEYRELYPNGESESPYVFICSKPEQLPVVFPIKGQHKIYQIDQKIHNVACKTLLRLRTTKG